MLLHLLPDLLCRAHLAAADAPRRTLALLRAPKDVPNRAARASVAVRESHGKANQGLEDKNQRLFRRLSGNKLAVNNKSQSCK